MKKGRKHSHCLRNFKNCWKIRSFHPTFILKHLKYGLSGGRLRLNRVSLWEMACSKYLIKTRKIKIHPNRNYKPNPKMKIAEFSKCKFNSIKFNFFNRINNKLESLCMKDQRKCARELMHNFIACLLKSDDKSLCLHEKIFFEWFMRIYPSNHKSSYRLNNFPVDLIVYLL